MKVNRNIKQECIALVEEFNKESFFKTINIEEKVEKIHIGYNNGHMLIGSICNTWDEALVTLNKFIAIKQFRTKQFKIKHLLNAKDFELGDIFEHKETKNRWRVERLINGPKFFVRMYHVDMREILDANLFDKVK